MKGCRTAGGQRVIDLGEAGLDYLREQLAYGGRLAKLLSKAPLDQGRVLTKAFSASDLPKDFDNDLDPSVSKLQWRFAIDVAVEFLGKPDHPVAVFEHPFATPEASWLASKPVPFVTSGDDVLFVINSSWARPHQVELALVTAGAQHEFGVLTHSAALSEHASTIVTSEILEDVVARMRGIILRAFDAEGYLVWLQEREFEGLSPLLATPRA